MANQIKNYVLIFVLLATSCTENPGLRTRRASTKISDSVKDPSSSSDGRSTSSSATQTENPFSNSSLLDTILETGNAEIIHLIDPQTGTFKKKVTLEKNYAGYFYLSGLNITSLRSNIVKVRFTFGKNLEAIDVPATVGRAPGLTPQSDIEVLILDFSSRPLQNLRLLYDLYDYNDYRDDEGNETKDPVLDPYDNNLYCRGLRLEHDSTFEGTTTNSSCDEEGETCLYAYAKIIDNGLAEPSDREVTDTDNIVSIVPSLPQVATSDVGYQNESVSIRERRCLPDSISGSDFELFMMNSLTEGGGLTNSNLSYDSTIELHIDPTLEDSDGSNKLDYKYRGPYRSLDTSEWEIQVPSTGENGAVFSGQIPTGVFQEKFSGNDDYTGYKSYLFPRRGLLELRANVQHMSLASGSESFDDNFALEELLVSGDSSYMYGCNIRMSEFDEFSREGIQSCNITAKIEIVVLEDGNEVVLNTAIDTKLQVIRPSVKNYLGEEVLYTSMKSCSSSNLCASDECCFNNRCWHNSLVSQCKEEENIIGHLQVGEQCNTDLECSSFCCNPSSQVCGVHMKTYDEQVLCSKPPESSCVSKEFCRKENVVNCFIVTTGVDPLGNPECALRCYNVPTHGDCINNKCKTPSQPAIPVFDPENPNCEGARSPPTAQEVELDLLEGSTSSGSDSSSGSSSSSSGGTSGGDTSTEV
jgi:hypothetical protein